jgi:hypothetical protein
LSQVKGWEGAVAICLDDDLVGMYLSPEYRTFRCIDGEANAEYMARLIVTPWFWSQLSQLSKGLGGRRERTRPEQFLQLVLSVLSMPSWEQQQKAVGILRKMGQLCDLQVKMTAELDALLPAVLNRAFRGVVAEHRMLHTSGAAGQGTKTFDKLLSTFRPQANLVEIVAPEKQEQACLKHQQRLGEREGLADQASKPLA